MDYCFYFFIDAILATEDAQPTKIAVIPLKPIDASHAVVIELMESGFSEAESVMAAQRFGGNTEAALDFLIGKSEGMELDPSYPLVEKTRYANVCLC